MTKPKTVNDYLNNAPEYSQLMLGEIRTILQKVAPNASEELKWGVPVFVEKRILFSYSAHKSHLTFMPTALSMKPFEKELLNFKKGKDTIQFSYDKPLPKELIIKIATHRMKDVLENNALWKY